MDSIKDAITSDQAATMLGVTTARIRQLVAEGKIEGVKRAEAWFFTKDAIEAAMNRPKSKGGRPKKAQAQA